WQTASPPPPAEPGQDRCERAQAHDGRRPQAHRRSPSFTFARRSTPRRDVDRSAGGGFGLDQRLSPALQPLEDQVDVHREVKELPEVHERDVRLLDRVAAELPQGLALGLHGRQGRRRLAPDARLAQDLVAARDPMAVPPVEQGERDAEERKQRDQGQDHQDEAIEEPSHPERERSLEPRWSDAKVSLGVVVQRELEIRRGWELPWPHEQTTLTVCAV